MPFYLYEAEDAYGKPATGILEAETPAALRDQLIGSEFRLKSFRLQPDAAARIDASQSPTAVHGMTAASSAAPVAGAYAGPYSATVASGPAGAAASGRQAVSQHCLSLRSHAILFREFGSAFRSGMTAAAACDMIAGRYRSGPLFKLLSWVKSKTQMGSGFADSLASSPVTLQESSIGIIRAGERGGFLPFVLDELAVSYERQMYLENRIKPLKLVYLYIGLPIALLMWPFANFSQGVFSPTNNGTSAAKNIALGFQGYEQGLLHNSLPAAMILLLLCFAWKLWTRTSAGERAADAIGLKLPGWGVMQRSLCLARFARILGHLYHGGIPLRDSWDLAARSVPNRSISKRLLDQDSVVAANNPLSAAMRSSGLYDDSEISMVATGEQTGEVDAMLFRLAAYEEDTIQRSATTFNWSVRGLFLLGGAVLTLVVLSHFWLTFYNSMFHWADGS
ncbi:MAG TPA: type II secretion system F family protein [Armatimonadota bacterium]|nr:type II secretion system F family protein [Armatimonadota bacterium]